jgi:ABC-type phosphate/phosphonate transport system ATPase subunit
MSTYDGLKAQDLAEAFSSLGLQPLGEILIAVVGVTGSGKSRFLRMVTQNNDIVVGENLDSGQCLFNFFHVLVRSLKSLY